MTKIYSLWDSPIQDNNLIKYNNLIHDNNNYSYNNYYNNNNLPSPIKDKN